ncbi:MAG: hypothetical protein AABY18_04870 [Candidatus Thermoplasmatota archaeon]
MSEWTNPIFYFNALGFVAALLVLVKARDRLQNGWLAAVWVLAVATGLHFIGDLFGASEDLDHVFIHGALLVALAFPAISALRA